MGQFCGTNVLSQIDGATQAQSAGSGGRARPDVVNCPVFGQCLFIFRPRQAILEPVLQIDIVTPLPLPVHCCGPTPLSTNLAHSLSGTPRLLPTHPSLHPAPPPASLHPRPPSTPPS